MCTPLLANDTCSLVYTTCSLLKRFWIYQHVLYWQTATCPPVFLVSKSSRHFEHGGSMSALNQSPQEAATSRMASHQACTVWNPVVNWHSEATAESPSRGQSEGTAISFNRHIETVITTQRRASWHRGMGHSHANCIKIQSWTKVALVLPAYLVSNACHISNKVDERNANVAIITESWLDGSIPLTAVEIGCSLKCVPEGQNNITRRRCYGLRAQLSPNLPSGESGSWR